MTCTFGGVADNYCNLSSVPLDKLGFLKTADALPVMCDFFISPDVYHAMWDDVPCVTYPPLAEVPDLFQKLADVKTVDHVLKFANSYGDLTDNAVLFTWRRESEIMRQAVTIWEAWKASDIEVLSRHFQWTQDETGVQCVRYVSHPEVTMEGTWQDRLVMTICSEKSQNGIWSALSRPHPFLAAHFYLLQLINRQLWYEAELTLCWDADENRFVNIFWPRSLLGAIWLQFEHFVNGHQEVRMCRWCGRLLDISQDGYTVRKNYCNSSCRSKFYRERKEREKEAGKDGE